MGKKTITIAGLLALGATALGACGPQVPPHEVRIEYLRRELYPNGSFNVMASPYFNLMNIGVVDGWDLSISYLRPRPTSLNLLAGLDRDETSDGIFDDVLVLEITLKGKRGCELQRSDLAEHLQKKMDKQYERSTEAGYVARAFKRGEFRGVVEKVDFEELLGLCSADDKIPTYVLDMIPDEGDINPDLLKLLREGE